MRKLYLFNLVTLDGFFEGPNHDISWFNVDDQFLEFSIDQLNQTDTLIFGRITYQMMASYWQTEMAIKNDPLVANKMNSLPKLLFSRTLMSANWNNTRLIKGDAAEEISQLKRQPGKDIAVLGSADLASTFMQHGLIDEYRIMINPVVLGKGTPLFKNADRKLDLKLSRTKTFRSGNVLLCYVPKGS